MRFPTHLANTAAVTPDESASKGPPMILHVTPQWSAL
jgi:hypothetical protein